MCLPALRPVAVNSAQQTGQVLLIVVVSGDMSVHRFP
jgi:hypothetical protein